jgi:hypothetical protein
MPVKGWPASQQNDSHTLCHLTGWWQQADGQAMAALHMAADTAMTLHMIVKFKVVASGTSLRWQLLYPLSPRAHDD